MDPQKICDRSQVNRERSLPRAKTNPTYHDGVHYIVVVLLERGNGLCPGAAGLAHDQLDVLALHARLVDLAVLLDAGGGRVDLGAAAHRGHVLQPDESKRIETDTRQQSAESLPQKQTIIPDNDT